MTRTDNSIKNAKFAFLMAVVSTVIGFVAQRIFVAKLGSEYLGLNGLFSNILSILSVVELGFGNAIIFNLYKPIATGCKEKIISLMFFYRRVYRIIASIVLIAGLLVCPFIGYFVGDVSISENIYLLFILALLDVVCSYLLAYRRSILLADQKAFVINIIHTLYIVIMNGIQIASLFIFRSFLIYLVIKIISRIVENLVINSYVKRKYQYLKQTKQTYQIDDESKNSIKRQMKGLFLHKISSALVLSTDNLLISRMFGVVSVGLYANYYLVINSLNELFLQIFTSITASIGNLLVKETKEKAYITYKNMLFINSWLYSFVGTCVLCLIQPFIKLWFGEQFLLPFHVVAILVANFYIQGMRKTNARFKEAAGIYYEDRYIPIIEALVNLVSSVLFGSIFGIAGIFMGTILSSMVLYFYSYPVIVFKRLFNRSYLEYAILHLKGLFYAALSMIISFVLCSQIDSIIGEEAIFRLLLNIPVCLVIPNVVYLLCNLKSSEMNYVLFLSRRITKRIKAVLKRRKSYD